jgi:hypothetical protein
MSSWVCSHHPHHYDTSLGEKHFRENFWFESSSSCRSLHRNKANRRRPHVTEEWTIIISFLFILPSTYIIAAIVKEEKRIQSRPTNCVCRQIGSPNPPPTKDLLVYSMGGVSMDVYHCVRTTKSGKIALAGWWCPLFTSCVCRTARRTYLSHFHVVRHVFSPHRRSDSGICGETVESQRRSTRWDVVLSTVAVVVTLSWTTGWIQSFPLLPFNIYDVAGSGEGHRRKEWLHGLYICTCTWTWTGQCQCHYRQLGTPFGMHQICQDTW